MRRIVGVFLFMTCMTLSYGQVRIRLFTSQAPESVVFTVIEGDSVILKGRGYGHGVGLCQEGTMVMAEKGFTFRQIIDFYYRGVIISDIKYARKSENGF